MKVELRGNALNITGYVNAVERDSRTLPPNMNPHAREPFVERVRAKTFQRALERAPCVELRLNHNRRLGSTTDGALSLTEDAIGLRAEAHITDPETLEAARRGELRGWSFSFRHPKDTWAASEQEGIQRRTLEEFEMPEVSLLTVCPAYIATTVEMRADAELLTEERAAEDAQETVVDHDMHQHIVDALKIKGGTYHES